jgi:hypothetical protein
MALAPLTPAGIGADSGPCEILVIFDRDARRGHEPDEPS